MPCPRCGHEYVNVGKIKACSHCGYVPGYRQIDIVKILQENEQLKAENITLRKDLNFYKKMWLESSSD